MPDAPINRKVFFDTIRPDQFDGALSAGQVEGCERILAYREEVWPGMPDNELAYLLGTVKWETGHSMQPVEEGFPMTGARLRAFQKSLRYYPFYGRGLVQITHATNYEKFGIKAAPAKALEWPTALDICFRGMILGMFTGKRLSDYFAPDREDWLNARRIVNGTDQAERIADIARGFYAAIIAARAAPTEPETPAVPLPPLPPTPLPPTPLPPGPPAALVLGVAAVLGWLVIVGLLLGIRAEIQALPHAAPIARPK